MHICSAIMDMGPGPRPNERSGHVVCFICVFHVNWIQSGADAFSHSWVSKLEMQHNNHSMMFLRRCVFHLAGGRAAKRITKCKPHFEWRTCHHSQWTTNSSNLHTHLSAIVQTSIIGMCLCIATRPTHRQQHSVRHVLWQGTWLVNAHQSVSIYWWS